MRLNRRRVVGTIALILLLLLALAVRFIADIPQGAWDPTWSLAYIVGLSVALFMAFYDRKNFPEKTWDFNPRRDILYFFLGWVIFPLSMALDAISGAEFTMTGMALGTLIISLFIGVAGTFTENVGI